MTNAEQFQVNVDAFLTACEALSDKNMWNEEEYGNVQAFYVNDLVCIITRIIAADGMITEKEVKLLGEVFGFDYSVEELEEVYEICAENIDEMFETGVNEAYALLKEKDLELAESYKELLLLAGKVAMESDGLVANAEAEKEAVQKLQKVLG